MKSQLLSVRTATYVVVASMVGSGILTTSGFIIQSTGSHWVNLVLWVVGAVISLTGALTLSEMATAYPHTGGDYIYVREALGNAWAFVYGWACLLIGYAAPIALIAYTTGNYFYEPLCAVFKELGIITHIPFSPRSFNLCFASIAIVVLTIQHARGHKESSAVQEWTTIFKIIVFVVMLFVGALNLPEEYMTQLSAPSSEGGATPSNLALGLVQVMYAYTGWNAAVYIAAELPNPKQTVPRALLRGTIWVALLYLALNVFYGVALSAEDVQALSADEVGRIAAVAMQRIVGVLPANIFSGLISLGMLASLSAFILVGPRIAYAMGQDRLIHQRIGRLSEKNGLPVSAIIFQGVLSLLLLWSGSFEQLLNFAGFGLGVLSLISVSTIFLLRRKTSYQPMFRVMAYPWVPMIFCAISTYMLAGSLKEAPVQALTGVVGLLLGFPIYHLTLRRRQPRS